MKSQRYPVLDGIRGLALLNMIMYHGVWDLVYLFGVDWKWFQSEGAYVWQQCICWTFILLSGFCYSFGHKKLKRGCVIFLLGFLISMITWIIMPERYVMFGILTLIGSCMLLIIPIERILKKCNPMFGLFFSIVLFLLTKNVNHGFLGFGSWNLIALPDSWYRNLATAYLGFPMSGFSSTDYFSLFPWIFLFTAGYFMYLLFVQKNLMLYLKPSKTKPIEWIGRHSLGIYVIHQPLIYFFLKFFLE